ncbi:hypothetical protein IWW34DRAFT_754659 [Fusarium oxysporum f. sp. albedinis]|nr:hypothetical protein IWW34DRAFT_754659 [Fusarium oxysporum f. sp. albedinis]
MYTLLERIGPLKPEIRLAQAIAQFEMDLSGEQKAAFDSNKRQSCHSPPNIHDVMRLTAEIDRRVAGNVGGGRCFGTRLVNVLEAVQRFAALGGHRGGWIPEHDCMRRLVAGTDDVAYACERFFLVSVSNNQVK